MFFHQALVEDGTQVIHLPRLEQVKHAEDDDDSDRDAEHGPPHPRHDVRQQGKHLHLEDKIVGDSGDVLEPHDRDVGLGEAREEIYLGDWLQKKIYLESGRHVDRNAGSWLDAEVGFMFGFVRVYS